MESEAQRRANLKYRKQSVMQVNFALYPDDQDIADFLKGKQNKAAYLRDLIRSDMEKKSS